MSKAIKTLGFTEILSTVDGSKVYYGVQNKLEMFADKFRDDAVEANSLPPMFNEFCRLTAVCFLLCKNPVEHDEELHQRAVELAKILYSADNPAKEVFDSMAIMVQMYDLKEEFKDYHGKYDKVEDIK